MRTVRAARWIPGLLVVILAALAAAAAIALDFPQPAQAQSDEPTGRIVVRPWVDDDGDLTRVEFGFRPAWGEDVRGGGDGPDDLFPPKRFLTQGLIESSAGRWLRSSEILIPNASGSEEGVRGRILVRAEADDDGDLARIEFGFRPNWGEDIRGTESGPDDIFPTNRFLTRTLIDRSAAKWLRSSLIAVPAERPTEPTEGEVGEAGGTATTEDGATITVPAGAAEPGAEITARVVPEEELPPLPDGATARLGGWDFEVEGELTGTVTLSLPLPADEDETWFLGHYDGERWYLEPFTIEGDRIIVRTDSLSILGEFNGIPVIGDVVQAIEDVGRYVVKGVKALGEAIWDGVTWTVDWALEELGLTEPVVCNRPDESVRVTNPTGGGLLGIYLKGCAQRTFDGPLLVARNPRHIWFEVRPLAGAPEHATSVDIYQGLSDHDEGTLLGPGAVGEWRPVRDGTVQLQAELTWTAAGLTLFLQPLREMLEGVVGFALPSNALTRIATKLLTADELRVAVQQYQRGNREAALRTVATTLAGDAFRDLIIDVMVAAAQRAGVTVAKGALIKAYALYKVAQFLVKRAIAGAEFFKVLIAKDEERLGRVAYTVPRSICWGGDITEGTVNGRWNRACQSQRLDGSYARYYRFELDETQEVTLDLNSSLRSAVYVSQGITRTAKPVRAFTEASNWARAEMEAGTYTIEVATRTVGRTGRFELRVELADPQDDESEDEDEPEPLPPIGDGSLVVLQGTQDLYQMHVVDGSLFKRLILNSVVFDGYGFQLSDVRSVEQAEFDRWTTTDLARLGDDARVWRLFPDGGEGVRRRLDITAEQFEAAGFDWDAVISINRTEFYAWTEGPPITAAELGLESERDDTPPADEGRFSAVSAGRWHTCGLRTNGAVVCWGDNEYGQTDAPGGTFSAVSAGWFHTCGLRASGAVVCWGWNDPGQTDAPSGAFSAVSAGWGHTCGLRPSGAVECWGYNHWGQTDAPGGTFSAVSAGLVHTCGLRASGAVECWGANYFGQTDAPGGAFSAVSAGEEHTCGLRVSGAIECWGNNRFYQTNAPGGMFSAVSAGTWHTCGLRTSGAVECWGSNEYGQTNAPGETFSAVSAGTWHTCGLRTSGAVVCWGDNVSGRTDAPGGAFSAVSAGRWHTCGLREDRTVSCWMIYTSAADVPAWLREPSALTVSGNRPPEPVGAIPTTTIAAGSANDDLRVGSYFRDADGDDLAYRASSSDSSIVSVRVRNSRLTVTGRRVGSATITLTAADPGGLTAQTSFRVTVSAPVPEPPQISITCPAYAEARSSFSCTASSSGGAVDTWDWSASGVAAGGRDETYSVWISSFGRHIVRLTASNAGGSDSDSTTVRLVAAPPASRYSRCGTDRITVWWFDRDNFRKHHVNLSGGEATRILGPRWWATIGHLTQPACDSWPTGLPLTAANYR